MARPPAKPAKEPDLFGSNDPLPLPKSPRLPPASFFDYWREIEQRWPERCVAYIYRAGRPRLDRTKLKDADGKPKRKNIDTRGFFEESYLVERWGEGDYKIRLNDPYKEGGQKTICETVVKINDPDHPAVIEDLREIDWEHEDNKQFCARLRAKGILPPGEHPLSEEKITEKLDQIQQTVAAAATAKPDAATQSTMDIVGEVARKAVVRAFDDQDPTRRMRDMVELLGALKTLMPQPPAADPAVAQLAEALRDLRAEVARLRDQPAAAPNPAPAPPEDPITAKLKERLAEKAIEKIDAAMDEPATPPGAPWWVPMLSEAAGKLFEVGQAYIAIKSHELQRQQKPQRQPATVTIRPQPQATPPPQPKPQPAAADVPRAIPEPNNDEEQTVLANHILNTLRPTLTRAFQQRWNSDQFRAEMERRFGVEGFAGVCQMEGVAEMVYNALAKDKQFGPIVQQDPENIRSFVNEVLHAEEEEDIEDDEEENDGKAEQADEKAEPPARAAAHQN